MAALHIPSASFLQVFLPVARASLRPSATVAPHPLLQQLQRRANNALLKTSFLAGVLSPIPGLLKDLWDGLLNAVPKKKTSHMKKRHRQMAGKALKDVTALNKCSSCGRLKRAHVLCPYCVMSIKQWFGNGFRTPADIEEQALAAERRELLDLPGTTSSTTNTTSDAPSNGVASLERARKDPKYNDDGSWQKKGLRFEDSARFQTDRSKDATEATRQAAKERKQDKYRLRPDRVSRRPVKTAPMAQPVKIASMAQPAKTARMTRAELGAILEGPKSELLARSLAKRYTVKLAQRVEREEERVARARAQARAQSEKRKAHAARRRAGREQATEREKLNDSGM